MTMSDPIADMLTRIRNASQARHSSCEMPYSRMKASIAEVLRDEGYIESFEERGEGIHKILRVYLRYAPGGRGRDPVLMAFGVSASLACACMPGRPTFRASLVGWARPSCRRRGAS